jgi:hypothetical protein
VARTVRPEIEKLADDEFAIVRDPGAGAAPAQRPGTLEDNLAEAEPSTLEASKTNMRPLPSFSSTAETASKEAPQELPGTSSVPSPVESREVSCTSG